MATKKANTVERVYEIAKPLAEQLGLEIWDIRYLKEGADWYLRVFIDKTDGVGIDDCVNMSHALDKPLDEGDFIPNSYTLEVSSPGVERELVRAEHFEKCKGEAVKIKLIRPDSEGKREFTGILESYHDGEITLTDENGEAHCINKKETAFIRLDDFGGLNQ